MEIDSLSDLEKIESLLATKFKKFKLGDILHSLYLLRKNDPELKPFMIAGVALFAIRFCHPSKASQVINNYDIRPLVDLCNKYYLADPITFDQNLHHEFINSNPVFMMLRPVSSQFPFEPGRFSEFSRPPILYHEIPKQIQNLPNIPNFDFESKFQAITGVSVIEFITVGFVIFSACNGWYAVNRDYFKKLRKKGVNIPDESTVTAIINQLAVDKLKLIHIYESRKNEDRRFRMYDFNPLLSYPIIKPCQNKQFTKSDEDFIHAPVPELVSSRISTGIFYQMFNNYTTSFSNYFGYVFEIYVGRVLSNCVTTEQLLSESNIREFYPDTKGKAPDWILIDGTTLILFECKATRFSRAAQTIASEDTINSSLKQIIKGLKQMNSFISACQAGVPELQRFHGCSSFKPVLVSLETLHLINSILFREHIDNLLKSDGITLLDWQILSIDELETLQPHIADGFRPSQILDDLLEKRFNEVLQDLLSQTNKTFFDSFLYQEQEELYARLGISGLARLKRA